MALSILINVDFCYGLEFSYLRPYCHYLPFPCISQVNMMMMSQNSMTFLFFHIWVLCSSLYHELSHITIILNSQNDKLLLDYYGLLLDYLYFFPELSKLLFQSDLLHCCCPRTFVLKFPYTESPPHLHFISPILWLPIYWSNPPPPFLMISKLY